MNQIINQIKRAALGKMDVKRDVPAHHELEPAQPEIWMAVYGDKKFPISKESAADLISGKACRDGVDRIELWKNVRTVEFAKEKATEPVFPWPKAKAKSEKLELCPA